MCHENKIRICSGNVSIPFCYLLYLTKYDKEPHFIYDLSLMLHKEIFTLSPSIHPNSTRTRGWYDCASLMDFLMPKNCPQTTIFLCEPFNVTLPGKMLNYCMNVGENKFTQLFRLSFFFLFNAVPSSNVLRQKSKVLQ